MATCLRMLLRVPMQSDNSFSMVRPLVRSRRACNSKTSVWILLQLEFSNDQVENSFHSDCGANAISDQRILRWRFAVCELVYTRSKRFSAGMSLVGTFRTSQAMQQCPRSHDRRL